jgi:hypothetical protein
MADATVSMENTSQTPTALGPQLEDPPRAAPVVAVAVLEVAVATVAVVAAAAEAHHMARAEELVETAIGEAEATRIATSPATHVAATTPATGLMRSVAKRLLKQATATVSPPTLHNFATCSFLRSSNLSGSPSTMQSKTQFSGSGVIPYPLKMLVATTMRSASTSLSIWTKPHSLGSSRSTRTQSTSGPTEGSVH